jgi:hypothetical protein
VNGALRREWRTVTTLPALWGSQSGGTAEGSKFESRQGQEFSLLHVVQTGSGAQPVSYRMGTEGSSPKGIAAGSVKLTTQPPTSAEVKKIWIYTYNTPPPPIRLYAVYLGFTV